jgi:hypothetical protein
MLYFADPTHTYEGLTQRMGFRIFDVAAEVSVTLTS